MFQDVFEKVILWGYFTKKNMGTKIGLLDSMLVDSNDFHEKKSKVKEM